MLIESWWHDLMLGWRTDAAVAAARVFEFLGSVPSVIVTTLGLVAVFLIIRRFRDALTLAAVMGVSEAITAALKVAISRPRPADSISDIGHMSFPSGHTAAAAALALTLALVLGRRLWAPAVAWVVLMGWSRTCLEAHWLGDVAAGAILGASVALLVRWAVSAGERRLQRETANPLAKTSDRR
ncbi:MAG TPA: phosphatase PAP2 family protein [Microbacterium sp.]|nr:phosphatase PAP2 family protein [Microbacterium sp.]